MSAGQCTFEIFTDNLCLSVIDHSVTGLLLEAVIFIFAFGGLALAAEHLCNAMETLCERWRIHEDVGGATFIAFGGAIPEITINCISTLKSIRAKSAGDAEIADMGVGAILGSGMIAYLLIPASCKLLADRPLLLRKRSVYRDALFYMLAVFVLGSALYAGISVYHAPIMVAIYACYVFLLVFSDHLDFFWNRHKFEVQVATKPREVNAVHAFVRVAEIPVNFVELLCDNGVHESDFFPCSCAHAPNRLHQQYFRNTGSS